MKYILPIAELIAFNLVHRHISGSFTLDREFVEHFRPAGIYSGGQAYFIRGNPLYVAELDAIVQAYNPTRLVHLDHITSMQYGLNELREDVFFSVTRNIIKLLKRRHMTTGNQETLPEEYKAKLFSEIEQLRVSLDNRIPEFGIQLQVVLGRLQELPEAAWALTDGQRKIIVDGFKQNANVTVFREAKTSSIKNHKIKGDLSPDMF